MSTSVPSAQVTVVTVGLGVLTIGVINAARSGKRPSAGQVIGSGAAMFGLSAIANGAPEFARNLALLWGVSALIVSGGPALQSLTKAVKPASSKSTTVKQSPVYV